MGIYAVVPEVLVAGGDGLGGGCAVVEGEVECDGAVAAYGIES